MGVALWNDPIPPTWYVPLCRPGHEQQASEFVRQCGADDCWYPSTEVWSEGFGKRQKVLRKVAVAPGYLFVLCDRAPRWDAWAEHPGSCLTGVLKKRVHVGDETFFVPCPIREEDLAQMAEVPERLQELRRQEQEAKAIRPGVVARFKSSLLFDYPVDVCDVRGEEVLFHWQHMPSRTPHKTTVEALERLLVA